MFQFKMYFLGCMLLFALPASGQHTNVDSTEADSTKNKINFSGFLSTSALAVSNWKNGNYSSLSFSGSFQFQKTILNCRRKSILELRSELAYSKFSDSTWIKNADNIFLSMILINTYKNKIKKSFSVSIKTQLTNSWDYNNQGMKKWKSGPLMPFVFITGYGVNRTFLTDSYINASIFSAKINSGKPHGNTSGDKYILGRLGDANIESSVGTCIQVILKIPVNTILTWEYKSIGFYSALRKGTITADVQNSLIFKPGNFFSIKLDNKISYDQQVSKKIQIRYELLLGFLYPY